MAKRTVKKRSTKPGKIRKSGNNTRSTISLVAGVLIGLTLLVSGTGKIIGAEGVPAQIVDFISNIIPDVFITPATLSFLYNILIPHVFPWAELILGVCLLIGFLPRLMAVLTIPLLLSFLGTNLWAIIHGGYTTCASCFGIWENYLGSLTPAQSLIYDLALIAFAVLVIIFHPGGFLSSRKWLENLAKGKGKLDGTTIKSSLSELGRSLRDFGSKTSIYLKAIGGKARQHPYIALVSGICVLGLIAYGVIAVSSRPAATVVSDIRVEASETSAVISWTTNKPAISSLKIYAEDLSFIANATDENPVTAHRMLVEGLVPDSTYMFKILSVDNQALSKVSPFKTLPIKPLTISNIRASYINESSATITWGTSKPTTGEVEYWTQTSKERQTASSSELATQHSINLTSLETDTIYHYQILSKDVGGTQSVSPQLGMSAQLGKPAPDFTLTSIDGNTISLSDYLGKPVMLDFWMWTCSACREKMTIVQEAYARIPPDKAAILTIHYMGRESAIQSYVEGERLTVPVLLDSAGTVTSMYNVKAFSTVFFIDSNGIIRLIDTEFNNAEELENIFSSMLGAD